MNPSVPVHRKVRAFRTHCQQSLLDLDVELAIKLNPNIRDREIRLDNGWVIKISRGLDFYQKPGG
jgi:ATP-dependent Lon protease